MQDGQEIGYDVPAAVGMAEDEVQTPALIVDLDAFEANLAQMRDDCAAMGVALRPHGKMHKCAEVAQRQIALGASGICCQKLSEAEAFARAGIRDLMVTNQVTDPLRIGRLVKLGGQVRVSVCVDDAGNVAALSRAAEAEGVTLDVLVEIDCGSGRCGVAPGAAAVELAQAVAAAPGLRFAGLQAYHGSAQHIRDAGERAATVAGVADLARETVAALEAAGLTCGVVGGGGTGTYPYEGRSGVYTELQCGSYAFMDADYSRVLDPEAQGVGRYRQAMFVLASVISTARAKGGVCDAGLKALAVDSGLPVVSGAPGVVYAGASDEHGLLDAPEGALRLNQRVRLMPGHCDPTVNLHDWMVAMRGGRVEALWPVTARGKLY
ncbi:DSD1 family PLP-dependent enzyme [Halovulum sp. GXIMD14794]